MPSVAENAKAHEAHQRKSNRLLEIAEIIRERNEASATHQNGRLCLKRIDQEVARLLAFAVVGIKVGITGKNQTTKKKGLSPFRS
jgi:hypothetical protein